ncbi:MAG: hypothetical protein MSS66_10690 [Selenomonadaceae bacterium]|nr:hypothetical protein [Selenomonadaceae bacterium]
MCEVIERNRAEGRLSLLVKLVRLNKLSVKEAADEADMTEADFQKLVLS